MKNRLARINSILETLKKQRSASIDELAAQFRVSPMTVRRDLAHLEEAEQVRVFRGGAAFVSDAPLSDGDDTYDLTNQETINHRQKQRIGARAAQAIETGDVIFLDAGTTTEQVARSLGSDMDITIVCYSVNALEAAFSNGFTKIVLLGGQLHHASGVFESPEAAFVFERLRINKAFLSANAMEPTLGATCSGVCEVGIKQLAIRRSLTRYLLIDSSKIGGIHSNHFADLVEFDVVITDGPLNPEIRQSLVAQDVEVIEA